MLSTQRYSGMFQIFCEMATFLNNNQEYVENGIKFKHFHHVSN